MSPLMVTVADLRVGDELRALDQQRAFVLQQLRPDELVLGRHRADGSAAFLANALSPGTGRVDQMR
jgi:hypothetical protein